MIMTIVRRGAEQNIVQPAWNEHGIRDESARVRRLAAVCPYSLEPPMFRVVS
jgi:hypothetical protein